MGVAICPTCGKETFASRHEAKAAARNSMQRASYRRKLGNQLREYECPIGNGWHFGNWRNG